MEDPFLQQIAVKVADTASHVVERELTAWRRKVMQELFKAQALRLPVVPEYAPWGIAMQGEVLAVKPSLLLHNFR